MTSATPENIAARLAEIGAGSHVEVRVYHNMDSPYEGGQPLKAGQTATVPGSFAVGLVKQGAADFEDPEIAAYVRAPCPNPPAQPRKTP